MRRALDQARLAEARGEVPIGAVLVVGTAALAEGYNRTICDVDPCAHAEIVVLREGARRLGNHRTGGTLYVTLEPCLMCMGAMVQARIERLVFAACDAKAGAARSLYRTAEDERLNHRFPVDEGPLADVASQLLTSFFAQRRAGQK